MFHAVPGMMEAGKAYDTAAGPDAGQLVVNEAGDTVTGPCNSANVSLSVDVCGSVAHVIDAVLLPASFCADSAQTEVGEDEDEDEDEHDGDHDHDHDHDGEDHDDDKDGDLQEIGANVISALEDRLGEASEQLQEAGQNLAGNLSAAAQDAADRLRDAAAGLPDRLAEAGRNLGERLSEAGQNLGDRLSEAGQNLGDRLSRGGDDDDDEDDDDDDDGR